MSRCGVGDLVDLYCKGAFQGPLGTWLVGSKTLWDVSSILRLDIAARVGHKPSMIYDSLDTWHYAARANFDCLETGEKAKIITLLKRKTAEKMWLPRFLAEKMVLPCST